LLLKGLKKALPLRLTAKASLTAARSTFQKTAANLFFLSVAIQWPQSCGRLKMKALQILAIGYTYGQDFTPARKVAKLYNTETETVIRCFNQIQTDSSIVRAGIQEAAQALREKVAALNTSADMETISAELEEIETLTKMIKWASVYA
jgi:hypothetical protein